MTEIARELFDAFDIVDSLDVKLHITGDITFDVYMKRIAAMLIIRKKKKKSALQHKMFHRPTRKSQVQNIHLYPRYSLFWVEFWVKYSYSYSNSKYSKYSILLSWVYSKNSKYSILLSVIYSKYSKNLSLKYFKSGFLAFIYKNKCTFTV